MPTAQRRRAASYEKAAQPDEGNTPMNIRIVQALLTVVIVVLVMLAQFAPHAPIWPVSRRADEAQPPFGQPARALAQDDDNEDEDNDSDNDDDNSDNDDDADNDDDNADNDSDNDDDSDNADNDSDDDNADNDDDDDDNDDYDDDYDLYEDADNVDAGAAGAGPVYTFDPSVVEATGRSTGADGLVALPGDRIVLQMFPWMPAGITLSVLLLDQTTVALPPGTPVGPLVFQVSATDAMGGNLSELPAEVNLSVRYTDQEVSGFNEQQVAMLWLDPFDQQWKPAPKQVADALGNYLAASVTSVGLYAVVIR
jgi:hypothetical protein